MTPRLGLIAGGGQFPVLLAQALRGQAPTLHARGADFLHHWAESLARRVFIQMPWLRVTQRPRRRHFLRRCLFAHAGFEVHADHAERRVAEEVCDELVRTGELRAECPQPR